MTTAPGPADAAHRTLAHYGANAAGFWAGTRDHDVRQNIDALLGALGHRPGLCILDVGCGPGRDLATLAAMGHFPTGLDGCPEFVRMARSHSGCPVLLQDFFDLQLPPAAFDGVFANASLFHLPRARLPEVLRRLRAALVAGGVLFCSNPRAFDRDVEGWQGERYGSWLTRESWRACIAAAGFTLEREYLRPEGKPPAEQPWLAMVWRRTADEDDRRST